MVSLSIGCEACVSALDKNFITPYHKLPIQPWHWNLSDDSLCVFHTTEKYLVSKRIWIKRKNSTKEKKIIPITTIANYVSEILKKKIIFNEMLFFSVLLSVPNVQKIKSE